MGLLFQSFWLDIVFAVISLAVYKYWSRRSKFQYFEKKGILHKKVEFDLKPLVQMIRQKLLITEMNDKQYNEFPEAKYYGFYQGTTPGFVIRDPELIKRMLTKDFSHFESHGFELDEQENPLEANLFSLKGDTWRTLRHKLTPTFTSGKLRWMFGLMERTADHLVALMDASINQSGNDLLIKDIYSRFSTDVIASCPFGVEAEAINDPNCQFQKMSKKMVNPSFWQNLKMMIRFLTPKVFSLLKLKSQPSDVMDFFISITKQVLEHRKRTGERRTDFLQLLLQLKERGSVELDVRELDPEEAAELRANGVPLTTNQDKLEITDELLAAQVILFFFAGFENTSNVMLYTSYLLAKDKGVQDRLRQEVRSAKPITYDSVKGMKLLDACVTETLRLFVPAPALMRKCNKNYTLEDGHVIEEGAQITIPVSSLQKDPKYWERPDEFYPDRFMSGWTPVPGTYLPFGDGPRICIAQRFVLMQIKLAMAKLIDKFEFKPSGKLIEPLQMEGGFIPQVKGGLWISCSPAA